jgi:hypothetical protein
MRKNLIALSLFNAAKILKEQEEAELAPPPDAQPAPPMTNASPGDGGPGVPRGKGGEPLTIENMIERFNVIRAGKSFDDPEVFGQLTTLYKGMEDDQKQKLDTLLWNIGKIVQNVADKMGTESASEQEIATPPPGAAPPMAPPGIAPGAAPPMAPPAA